MISFRLALFESLPSDPAGLRGTKNYIALPVTIAEQHAQKALLVRPLNQKAVSLILDFPASTEVEIIDEARALESLSEQINSIICVPGPSHFKHNLVGIIPANPKIPLQEWFDIDSVNDRLKGTQSDFDAARVIPCFLSFVFATSSLAEHPYKPSVLKWISSGLLKFRTLSPNTLEPSLHVEHINLSRTGPWTLSEFMTLDALIGDYLRSIGIDHDFMDSFDHTKEVRKSC